VADTQRRWLARMAREADREALRRLRLGVRAARTHRRTAVRRAREACKNARLAVKSRVIADRERTRAAVERLRAKLRERIASERQKVRDCCSTDRQAVKAAAAEKIERARAELAELKSRRAREQLWARKGPALTRADRKSESDSAVEAELSPDELIVWRKVKGQIKPRARMSRHEAFTHWLHEHAGEVAQILSDDADRELARLTRDEARQRKAMTGYRSLKPTELRRRVARVVDDLADVPF
jgi:hypothetical protein